MAPSLLKDRLERLPGWEIVSEGLADVAAGRITPFACAVWIAAPRLRRAGLIGEAVLPGAVMEPELQMYRLLRRAMEGNGYNRYRAILRRLVRFEHALDRELCRDGANA